MQQEQLFESSSESAEKEFSRHIGNRIFITFNKTNESIVYLYRRDVLIRRVNLADKVDKKLFITEVVEMGANQSDLAEVLNISRQTIHNYIETKKHFGIEGLIRNYNPSKSKRQNREEHADDSLNGNKARQLEKIRKEQKEKQESLQAELPFGVEEVSSEDQPFSENHNWEKTRYAGVFTYVITLIHLNDWLNLGMAFLGDKYKLLLTFLLMISNNVRSIEQIKNFYRREGGIILGIRSLPSKIKTRMWLYFACKLQRAGLLLSYFFTKQLRAGIVSSWLWFVDGHLLPYTGQNKVHSAFNTQRDMMVPGRSNIFVCDISGKVVDFEIQEGKGDIRAFLIELGKKWQKETDVGPVMVFDREAYGADFFYAMKQEKIAFVTWEKNIDSNKTEALKEEQFIEEFTLNGKVYKVFEEEKQFIHELDGGIDGSAKQEFTLRRIYIWNVTGGRRTAALSNVKPEHMSTQECAMAILNRWGASENTFKHMADKHPLNYQPGYSFTESQKQEISNPVIKEIRSKAGKIKVKLSGLYKKLTKTAEVFNTDGTPRKNSARLKVIAKIEDKEGELSKLKEEIRSLPEKVDISNLEDYRCFQSICNESKYLFDFVTSSAWNARKQMTEWLLPLYENKNEYIDLFYAITNCQGWIKSESKRVLVRLEPLEQPSRLAAQRQFCRRLTQLKVITPGGKLLEIEVGNCPINNITNILSKNLV